MEASVSQKKTDEEAESRVYVVKQEDIYIWPDGSTSPVLCITGGSWYVVDEIYAPHYQIYLPHGTTLYYVTKASYTDGDFLKLDVRPGPPEIGQGETVPYQVPFYSPEDPVVYPSDTDDSEMYDEDGNLIDDENNL